MQDPQFFRASYKLGLKIKWFTKVRNKARLVS